MTYPSTTVEDRKIKVKTFIEAYRSKFATVESYRSLANYLEMSPTRLIPPYDKALHRIQDTGPPYAPPQHDFEPIRDEDAKAYFDYLIGIVTGTQIVPEPEREKSVEVTFFESTDWVRLAIDQLHEIILAMTPHIYYRQDIYAMPDWQKKLGEIDKRLAALESNIDARDSKIIDVLTLLNNWLATYKGALDDAHAYFANKQPPRRGAGESKNVG
ncbi:MAG: hypothetical protein ABSC50_05965 [Candidatus Bathyarchaeia archaeon]